MSFNNRKFQLVQYGKNLNLRHDYNYLSPDYSAVIGPSTVVRDLGVQVNNSLNYLDQIEYIYKKPKQRINMILRIFSNRSSIFMKFYWKTYVQPILDYASQVWAPIEGGLLYKLESLLRLYTSKISDIKHLHYWQQLSSLKTYSLNRRYE